MLLIAVVMFLVYARSFSGFPVLERKVSLVGESDAASYVILWREYRPADPLGDPYRIEGRTLHDTAEKHRLHHPVSAVTGYTVSRLFEPVYRALGLPAREAAFAVSALWGALNIVLLGFLLRRWNPPGNRVWPFLLLYGISLSPWVYAAVPESWTLTTGLFLTYLLVLSDPRVPAALVAAALGLFMLNNMALAPAVLLLCLARWHEPPRLWSFVRRAALLGGIMLATWLAALTLLSLVDPGYRLDRLLAYSAWFRRFMGADLPLTDPYVWKAMLTNLFITSVTANQADPNMPAESLLYTLQHSWLGRFAVTALLALFATAAYRAFEALRTRRRVGVNTAAAVVHPAVTPVWFCVVMIGVTYALYYPSGFTYAALVLPMLVLILHRFLDVRRWPDRMVVAGGIAVIIVNNTAQILRFRETLAALP